MKYLILLTLCSCSTYQIEQHTNVCDTVTTKYGVFYLDSAGVIIKEELK